VRIYTATEWASSVLAAPTSPGSGPSFNKVNDWLIHNPLITVMVVVGIAMVWKALRGKIGQVLTIFCCALIGFTFIGVGSGWIDITRSFADLFPR
jgi:hypothetical protein